MPRVITASEVDRLHQQVGDLQQQVNKLEVFIDTVRDQLLLPNPAQTPPQPSELFAEFRDYNEADLPVPVETRSDADEIVESIVGRLPSDEAGASDQDGDFLQP
jgi:hypothetical protein